MSGTRVAMALICVLAGCNDERVPPELASSPAVARNLGTSGGASAAGAGEAGQRSSAAGQGTAGQGSSISLAAMEGGTGGTGGRLAMASPMQSGVAGVSSSPFPDRDRLPGCSEPIIRPRPQVVVFDSAEGRLSYRFGNGRDEFEIAGTIAAMGEGLPPELTADDIAIDPALQPSWLRIEGADGRSWSVVGYGVFEALTIETGVSVVANLTFHGSLPGYPIEQLLTISSGAELLLFAVDGGRGVPIDDLPAGIALSAGMAFCSSDWTDPPLDCGYSVGLELAAELPSGAMVTVRPGESQRVDEFVVVTGVLATAVADTGCCSDCSGTSIRAVIARVTWLCADLQCS